MRRHRAKHLLLVAFHYPPLQGSTGVTRSLAFSKYLKEYGWDVTVLTATTSAYQEIRKENLSAIPSHVKVIRGFALDTRRHLSVANKYPLVLAIPDRWQSWIVGGMLRAISLMLTRRPDAVMSTYPIASAHRLGLVISKFFGIPWLADFRDPMAQDGYPPEPRIYRAFQSLEAAVFGQAKRITVTTSGTAELYAARYPAYPRKSIVTISNGYDDDMFPEAAAGGRQASSQSSNHALVFLHSGLLYPKERDPVAFFRAVAKLRQEGKIDPVSLEFRFRASGYQELFDPLVNALGISDCVKFLPSISYQAATEEMRTVDAFLLFQASNCNQQIPAKTYEYLVVGKPILALTDRKGDTGSLLAGLGIDSIAALDSEDEIASALLKFIHAVKTGAAFVPASDVVRQFSRKSQTHLLADTLDDMIM